MQRAATCPRLSCAPTGTPGSCAAVQIRTPRNRVDADHAPRRSRRGRCRVLLHGRIGRTTRPGPASRDGRARLRNAQCRCRSVTPGRGAGHGGRARLCPAAAAFSPWCSTSVTPTSWPVRPCKRSSPPGRATPTTATSSPSAPHRMPRRSGCCASSGSLGTDGDYRLSALPAAYDRPGRGWMSSPGCLPGPPCSSAVVQMTDRGVVDGRSPAVRH